MGGLPIRLITLQEYTEMKRFGMKVVAIMNTILFSFSAHGYKNGMYSDYLVSPLVIYRKTHYCAITMFQIGLFSLKSGVIHKTRFHKQNMLKYHARRTTKTSVLF